MARQIARHLVSAVLRERIPVWAGPVYLDRRDGLGHDGVNAHGGAQETSSTLMRMAFAPAGTNEFDRARRTVINRRRQKPKQIGRKKPLQAFSFIVHNFNV